MPAPRTDPAPLLAALPPWARGVAFCLAAFVLCRLGDELAVYQGDFSTYWPVSGLLVAGLLLADARRRWRLAALAGLAEVAAGVAFRRSPGMIAAGAAADLAEAFLAAALIRRAVGSRSPVATLRGMLALILLGAVGAPLVGASLGAVAAAVRDGWTGARPAAAVWREWWAGDGLGVLLVAPMLLAWAEARPREPVRPARVAEALGLAAALGLSTGIVFGGGLHLDRSHLLLPALVWASVRFGVRGVGAGAFGVSLAAAWAAARSPGITSRAAGAEAEVQVQLLLAAAAATTLLLAVALEERRRALAALRESQVRFDAFVGHTPALILLKDFEGRALAASPSMEKLMGAAPGALVGTLAREWVSAELADRIEGEDRRVLETGEEVRREDVVRGHSLVSMKFRIPREGEPPLLGSIGLDVTELREAERALRLAQTALQRGYAAVLILDPGGRITYANEAAERLLGRPGAELRGRGLWEVDGAFDAPGWPDRFRALREGGPGVCRGAPTSPAGGRIEAEVQLSYLAFDGGEYVIYTARDLTDRRRAEVAERLAALGTLAAGVAHEINNPLTFVTANLAWAREQLERAPPDEPRTLALQALRDADEGSRRVARIVRDLGAVSRLPVGGRVPIDPRTEVGGALKLVQHQVRHRAGLVTRLEPVPPVRAAEFELGQVVVNLVVNAIHAIPEGEPERHEIRVATRTSPDGWAVVEVADTGHGIPEPLRGRIFEPFFTTKAVGEGTGLGLSVCHGLVTALGGRIEIESEPGRGSCFRVLLPPCLEAAPAAAPPPPDAGRRARVLVIDDEPQIGVAVRRILDDHEVTASADARAALRRLVGGERFDLILCDVMMPELSGVDLFEALAREAPDAAHRVVFITGGAFSERARRFLERSEAPRIDKPFASGELRALLAERLAQRAPAEARPGERG